MNLETRLDRLEKNSERLVHALELIAESTKEQAKVMSLFFGRADLYMQYRLSNEHVGGGWSCKEFEMSTLESMNYYQDVVSWDADHHELISLQKEYDWKIREGEAWVEFFKMMDDEEGEGEE